LQTSILRTGRFGTFNANFLIIFLKENGTLEKELLGFWTLPIVWNSKKNRNICVRFEVFTAVTMKNRVFWDVTPRGSSKNRRFGGT
jgi:hypothetical protein